MGINFEPWMSSKVRWCKNKILKILQTLFALCLENRVILEAQVWNFTILCFYQITTKYKVSIDLHLIFPKKKCIYNNFGFGPLFLAGSPFFWCWMKKMRINLIISWNISQVRIKSLGWWTHDEDASIWRFKIRALQYIKFIEIKKSYSS